MIEEIIDSLEDDEDAILLHPVNSQSLSATQSFFIKEGYAVIPEDYIDFLRLSNGFVYKGLIFFGTTAIEEEKMQDLITANEEFQAIQSDKSRLLIGKDRYTLYTYNSDTEQYEILDKEDLEIIEEFEDFEDMLSEIFEGDNGYQREEDEDDYIFEDDYED